MTKNLMRYEESSEVILDTETFVFATGWTPGNYIAVSRVGGLVAVHIEATFATAAAALVGVLPADFAPGDTVTTGDGKFTIAANGHIAYTGSTSAGASATCATTYQAGDLS
jgi:hypothetical protein